MAERAGAVSVMALERIPADIKKDGGIARASDPSMIREIMEATSIPVMAKARIGHFAEAQVCYMYCTLGNCCAQVPLFLDLAHF